jgi:hypothetical protein
VTYQNKAQEPFQKGISLALVSVPRQLAQQLQVQLEALNTENLAL